MEYNTISNSPPHQLLGRDRRPPPARMQRLKMQVELAQRRIHHGAHRPPWMILRNPLL
jgi:hypothetical protein